MKDCLKPYDRIATYGRGLHENVMQYAPFMLGPGSCLRIVTPSAEDAAVLLNEFRRAYPGLSRWAQRQRLIPLALGVWIHPQTLRHVQIENEIEIFEQWRDTPDPKEERIKRLLACALLDEHNKTHE